MSTKRFLYQANYCEENIWHLCQEKGLQHSYVVFIASLGEVFPMWRQRKADSPDGPVFWDYHVILLLPEPSLQVFDFDTTLGFGADLEAYFLNSFPNTEWLDKVYQPLFKLIPADHYVDAFCSDRSHMQMEGAWLAPPPKWPLIGDGTTNLGKYIDMSDETFGEVFELQAMLRQFTRIKEAI